MLSSNCPPSFKWKKFLVWVNLLPDPERYIKILQNLETLKHSKTKKMQILNHFIKKMAYFKN